MKTKPNRREISRKRQEAARQMAVWAQKILELGVKLRVEPSPEAREQLTMCKREHSKCLGLLQDMSTDQRIWASGRGL